MTRATACPSLSQCYWKHMAISRPLQYEASVRSISLSITVESVLCIYELGDLNDCLFNEAIFIWAHSRMNKSNMAANMHSGISVIVIILKNTTKPFLCVIPQPPLGAAFRNDWPRNWGANSERSRRNPVLNPSFMICSDVVGPRCLQVQNILSVCKALLLYL